jgi:thymidylate kinase
MKIIIFDGVSGSGKTTLRYRLFQELNYEVLTIDRFTPSMWVYEFLRTGNKRTDIFEIESEMSKLDCHLVLCTCAPDVSKHRVTDNNLRSVMFTPDQEVSAFNEYITISKYSRIINLDTSYLSVDDCITQIKGLL